jgi:uncharacterized protein YciI
VDQFCKRSLAAFETATREQRDEPDDRDDPPRVDRNARRLRRCGMKYVLLYESADDVLSKAPAHFPAHSARIQEFRGRGELLMIGTFGDPQREGSMAIFSTRAAAEEFVAGDPFVANGVVRRWEIRDWNDILETAGQGEASRR